MMRGKPSDGETADVAGETERTGTTRSERDFKLDVAVNGTEFRIVKVNFGRSGVAVPEPSVVVHFGLGALGLLAMRPRSTIVIVSLFAALGLLIGSTATATPLGPGESVSPPASVPSAAGFTFEASQNAGILEATFAGEWVTAVISGDTSNPYGGLTFVYLFTKAGQSTGTSRLVVEGFDGFQTDVGYDAIAVQSEPQAPTSISRDVVGDLITANYPGIDANIGFMSTMALLIRTDAHDWKNTSAYLTDGSTAVLPSFGPTVPEPSTYLLAVLAASGLMAFRRRLA